MRQFKKLTSRRLHFHVREGLTGLTNFFGRTRHQTATIVHATGFPAVASALLRFGIQPLEP